MTSKNREPNMVIKTNLNVEVGLKMIESILEQKRHELPEGKTINDFGGGYVECIKTKAKVVLYFGFDDKKNRVSVNIQVKKEDVLLWLQAISERIWNQEKFDENVVSFGDTSSSAGYVTVSNNGVKKPVI